ncbi:cytochrome b561 [Shimia gijangensis]|uniref:Cytochrome b561 n=1 Tax=Shimia gijangensis TaxID=1470563 RepID=A0A1M6KCE7_9RHOB|nr:cytochrome b [Shimia gijangensis]SHJ56653.1 cytochrome b561 [Shimia gijangensis]
MTAGKNWSVISRLNHWIFGLAMIAMLAFGIYLHEFVPRGPDKGLLIGYHKAAGVLVLIFGLWRVGYRLFNGFLEDASPMPKWQSVSAKVVHWVLLISVIAMPLSGLIGSYFGGHDIDVFGLFTVYGAMEPSKATGNIFMGMHGAFAKLTILSLVLHVAGAYKHHLIDKDDTLKRMVGRS